MQSTAWDRLGTMAYKTEDAGNGAQGNEFIRDEPTHTRTPRKTDIVVHRQPASQGASGRDTNSQ